MRRPAGTLFVLLVALLATGCAAPRIDDPPNIRPQSEEGLRTFPRIVLYSVSWCPHCREAKEYLTRNNIPFVNRDVEKDAGAMQELTETYKSTGVPVIVIGNDERILKGFSREGLEKALHEVQEK